MEKSKLVSLLVVISAVLLFSTAAFPASKNTFKFSDSYQDKIADPYGWGKDLWPVGKFKINAKINFEDGDIANKFNSNTCLDVEVGDFWLMKCLGDPESSYQEGDTRADILLSDEDYWSGQIVPYLLVQLKWNSKKLTMKITGLTGTPEFQLPIMALYYYWGDPGTYEDSTDAIVRFYNDDNHNATFDDNEDTALIDTTFNLYVRARVTMKKNRIWGDLYKASVKGNGSN